MSVHSGKEAYCLDLWFVLENLCLFRPNCDLGGKVESIRTTPVSLPARVQLLRRHLEALSFAMASLLLGLLPEPHPSSSSQEGPVFRNLPRG